MKAIDINDKKYKVARERGYLDGYINNVQGWEDSFVCKWVVKYPKLTKALDTICKALGTQSPGWSDFTEKNVKNIRDAFEGISETSKKLYFAALKSVLNDMKNEVEIPCTRFAEILKAKAEPSQHVYLTESELQSLADLEVKNERDKYVRNVFLICAYVGCRHSDGKMLTVDNIIGKSISYVSQKTRIAATVPVHRNLRKMLTTYDQSLNIYDDEYNVRIRMMCQRAGIKDTVKVYAGGADRVGQKWQFVASHTARRSFVTNLYMRGVDLNTIASLAGHTDTSMTERYLCDTRGLSLNAMQFFVA